MFVDDDDNINIYGDFESFGQIQKYVEDNGFELVSAEFVRIPNITKELTAEEQESVEKLLEKLEEDEDVTNVYSTMAESDAE